MQFDQFLKAAGLLEIALKRTARDYPFHAGLLSAGAFRPDPSVGTVGVTVRGGKVVFLNAPAFVCGCALAELAGVLHHEASVRGMETVSMWAPVSHYAAGLTNSKGSLALVRALERVAGVGVDVHELEEAAAAFEGQVARAVESEPRLRQLVEQLEDAAANVDEDDHGPLPTGDELAEELERFLRDREEPGS